MLLLESFLSKDDWFHKQKTKIFVYKEQKQDCNLTTTAMLGYLI